MLKNSRSGTYLIPYRGMGACRVYPRPIRTIRTEL
jgi:hypothetical protein